MKDQINCRPTNVKRPKDLQSTTLMVKGGKYISYTNIERSDIKDFPKVSSPAHKKFNYQCFDKSEFTCSGSSISRYFTVEEKFGFFFAFNITELWQTTSDTLTSCFLNVKMMLKIVKYVCIRPTKRQIA